MNSRERLLIALDLGKPDRVPTWDWFDEAVSAGVAQQLGLKGHDDITTLRKGDETQASVDLYCRVVEALEVDGTSSVYSTGLKVITDDFARDKYGRGYMLSEHGMPAVIEPAVSSMKELQSYDMISKLEPSDFDSLRAVIERMGRERAHCLSINGPFQEAWNVMGGMDKLMLAFIKNPELVHGVMQLVTDFNKTIMSTAVDMGVDFFMLDGDQCGNDYMLMSHEHFDEYIAPYKRQLVDHAHSLNRKIIKHTDGNAWPIMDDLIEIGFDAFHPVQPQCMEMSTTKAWLAGRLCVFGNVDCLDLLVFDDPEAVTQAVRQCIAEASPGGGHILCSSNSLHPGCKPENVIALFEAAKKYGDYADIPDTLSNAPPPPNSEPVRARRKTRRYHSSA